MFSGPRTDYINRQLSITYQISNSGSHNAENVEITGSPSSNSVTLSTPVPVSVGTIKAGSSAPVTLKYTVPPGVTSFTTKVNASAQDSCGRTYAILKNYGVQVHRPRMALSASRLGLPDFWTTCGACPGPNRAEVCASSLSRRI